MQLVFQVLSSNDIDEVYALAERRLITSIPDETERMFKSWTVKWRREALEHYLKLGWSFIARDVSGHTQGFFLAQPFLFFRGHTQTLWVEHIEAEDDNIRAELIDVAVRVAREKHLQRVLFADAGALMKGLEAWKPKKLDEAEGIAEVKTTKD